MIFLTVGSELCFDRLVKAVDDWCLHNKQHIVFGQIADPKSTGYRPLHFKWEKFIRPDEYERNIEQADLIVAHAGMGSIITALSKSRPILVMPRTVSLKETRNDHQIFTAERFSNRSGITVAENEAMIAPLLSRLIDEKSEEDVEKISKYADPNLIVAIREFIFRTV